MNFPSPFGVLVKDLPSSFSGKHHALLCRKYIKGRDWNDFIWYITNNVAINFPLLTNALYQTGPWKNQSININLQWLKKALQQKIHSIDWQAAIVDIAPFINAEQQLSLKVWGKEFFIYQLNQLIE